ncbi:MAG: hypothetical protein RLZZ227_2773 [Pseudomonadota bacterium]
MSYPDDQLQGQAQTQKQQNESGPGPMEVPRPGVDDPSPDLPGYEDPVNPNPPQDPKPPPLKAENPLDPNDTQNYAREAPDTAWNQRAPGGIGIQDQERPTGI